MIIEDEFKKLFSLYQTAFLQQDMDKLAHCYHIPCTLTTPDKFILLNDKSEFIAEFSAIFEQLKQAGVEKIIAKNSSFKPLYQSMYLVSIDWEFIDENEQVFTDFTAYFYLNRSEEEFKIINVTSHETEGAITLDNIFSW